MDQRLADDLLLVEESGSRAAGGGAEFADDMVGAIEEDCPHLLVREIAHDRAHQLIDR